MTQHYDVGVIGYGACAAVLVNLLVKQGLKVIVIEKEEEVLAIPRAAHFDDETVRTFQTFGAADDLSDSFTTSARYVVYDRHDKAVWGLNDFSTEPTDQGWLSDYFFFQPDFETYLRGRALEGGATVKLGYELCDFQERESDMLLTYRSTTGDNSDQIAVSYLVGADGANSFVRRHLDIGMESLAPSQRWLIVDIRVHDDVDVELSDHCWTKVGQSETITYIPMPNNMRRFELSMPSGLPEGEATSEEAVAEFLSRWLKPGEYDVLRANVYHFHSLVAESWRSGRAFIAGDAAHLMPPFLGQGVCTAIRDAMNLAWKLARVVNGEAPPALLDTYESERRPHAYTFVQVAGQVGEKISWMATATADELAAMQSEEHGILRPRLGPGLRKEGARGAGVLGPQPKLSDGTLLDYRIGYNFAVVGDPLLIDTVSPEAKSCLEAIKAILVPDDGPDVRSALCHLDAKAMVLRPDRYLLGLATNASELDEIIRGMSGPLLVGKA